jgi:hypothetical protein
MIVKINHALISRKTRTLPNVNVPVVCVQYNACNASKPAWRFCSFVCCCTILCNRNNNNDDNHYSLSEMLSSSHRIPNCQQNSTQFSCNKVSFEIEIDIILQIIRSHVLCDALCDLSLNQEHYKK